MDEREIGVTNMETSEKPIIPSGEIYIRIGYKGRGKRRGGKGIWVA